MSSSAASSSGAPACGSGLPAPFLAQLGSTLASRLVLVTGGAGFLGGHVVQVLLQAKAKVRVFDVAAPKPGHGVWTDKDPVEVITGNLLDAAAVSAALAGVWCVIHVASPSPTCRNAVLFRSVNIDGTKVLIDACLAQGVQRFVYTSSASVVFDGRDQMNFDESCPPPTAALDDYTMSKLAAEKIVLASNSSKLYTCAIRPHGIFGARDPHFLPVLAETGRKGKSKFVIGDGSNLVDFTYVENVAYAHALAAVMLGPDSRVNGREYFITNQEPMFFWEFITRMQRGWGWTLPWIKMPVAIMKPVAKMNAALGGLLGPSFTVQAINYSGCAHYYSSQRAQREMGYVPPISMDEAINRSLAYYWELRNKALVPGGAASKGNNNKSKKGAAAAAAPAPITSHALFVPSLIVALLAMLFASGHSKLFWLSLAVLAWWAFALYRSSFGAVPRMFVESARDKLVARAGRNIVITGANRGLGFETAKDLLARGFASAASGSTLFLGARDSKKGEEARAKLLALFPGSSISVLEIDTSSFVSLRAAVASLKKQGTSVHLLINNAGAMVATSVTAENHESQWAANYLGSFYFVQRLISEGVLSPSARIVNVSSLMHHFTALLAPFSESDGVTPKATGHGASSVGLYCRTKLAQILWAAKLQRVFNAEVAARRMSQVGKVAAADSPALLSRRTIVSVNPGAVATEFIEHFIPRWLASLVEPVLMALIEKTPEQGVQGIVWAAVAAEMENVGGVYADNSRVILPSKQARDEANQERLWEQSIQAVEAFEAKK